MKQMIQKMREEKDGFTLAELLVVVAIVAVLVAIAIPVFTSSLAKAQAETDVANCRSYYAEQVATYLENPAGYTNAGVPTGGTSLPISGQTTSLNGGTVQVTYGSAGFVVAYTVTNGADLAGQSGYDEATKTITWTNASMKSS